MSVRRDRMPFAPADAYLSARWPEFVNPETGLVTGEHAAVLCGTYPKKILHYRRNGVDCWQADRVACSLGWTPEAVWGDVWVDAVDREVERWESRQARTKTAAQRAFEQLRIDYDRKVPA